MGNCIHKRGDRNDEIQQAAHSEELPSKEDNKQDERGAKQDGEFLFIFSTFRSFSLKPS